MDNIKKIYNIIDEVKAVIENSVSKSIIESKEAC